MKNLFLLLVTSLALIAVVVLLSFLLAYPVMLLWNNSLLPAFKSGMLNNITWTQAWGINILFGIWFTSGPSGESKD